MSMSILELLREVYGVDLKLTIEEVAAWPPARQDLFFHGVLLMRHAASDKRLIYSQQTIDRYVAIFNDQAFYRC